MSQAIYDDIIPATTSGNELATLLNGFKDAVASGMIGSTIPPNLQAGGSWIDNSANPIWVLKMWTGAANISLITINTTTSTASFTSADDLFTVTKVSADVVSPILSLVKKRAVSGAGSQVLAADVVGTFQAGGNDNTGAGNVTARIRAIATNAFTVTTLGTDWVFEAITAGTAGLIEMMRLKNGKLGIGTSSPADTLHAIGNVRSDKGSDDAVGAALITRKRRLAGTTAVQSGDVIGEWDANSTDATATEQAAAKIVATATENHTSTNLGTKIGFFVKKLTTAVFFEAITLAESIFLNDDSIFAKTLAFLQQVDSTSTGSNVDLSPTKSILKVTNTSLVSIRTLANPTNGKMVILINGSTSAVSILNNGGGTTANQILTPTGTTALLAVGSVSLLIYDNDSLRWRMISGGGGSGLVVTTTQTVAAAATITTDQNTQQLRYVTGTTSGGGNAASTTPFGTGGWVDGTIIMVYGESDADYLDITLNDANYGAVGNFTTISLTKNVGMRFIWKNSALRWLASPL